MRSPEEKNLHQHCLDLLSTIPSAASAAVTFRRHWPSITSSSASLLTSLSDPSFPTTSPFTHRLLSDLSETLKLTLTLASYCSSTTCTPPLGKLRTNSDLASSAASLSLLASDAVHLLSSSSSSNSNTCELKTLITSLQIGAAASRSAALDSIADLLAAGGESATSEAAAEGAVSAISALLSATTCAPRDKAVALLAAFAAAGSTSRFVVEEGPTLLPHLARVLESDIPGAEREKACVVLQTLTLSRDAAISIGSRGGVASLLEICVSGTPSAQAAAAGVLKNLALFADLFVIFQEENALPVLIRLVSSGTTKAQENALGCIRNLTSGDGDEGERLKIIAFQEGALDSVKNYFESGRGNDDASLEPAIAVLKNLASFRYIAEIAVSAGLVLYVISALESGRSGTRAEAAKAIAELGGNGNGNGKLKKEIGEAVPMLIHMLESKVAEEREAAAKALAALLMVNRYRKLFKKDERGIVNVVQLLDPHIADVDKKFLVSILLAIVQSRRCRKQMVAAGACGFLQELLNAEVDGAKKLLESLGKGKILGVFPRA